jgi:hypothetical protein
MQKERTEKSDCLFDIPEITSTPSEEGLADKPTPKFDLDKAVDEMVGALTDPIIVWPIGGWGDSLPENIKNDITIYRMLQVMKHEEGIATWPEVCAYLYTVTLERPVGHEWADIYLYAMTQYIGDSIPADLKTETLDSYEMQLLDRFRRWLWDARHRARKHRSKEEGRSQEPEVEARAPQQITFF